MKIFFKSIEDKHYQWKKLKNSIGQLISPNEFLFTSRSRAVAQWFAANVIYQIDICTQSTSVIFADVYRFSAFPEEVLFDLGTAFRVNSVRYDDVNKYWIVNLSTIENMFVAMLLFCIKQRNDRIE